MCALSALSPGEEILRLVQSGLPFNLEELRKQEEQLPPQDGEWKCRSNWSGVTKGTWIQSDWEEYFICYHTKLFKEIWGPGGGSTRAGAAAA